MLQRPEQGFIEQLVAKATIEAFVEAVLLRLAGRNIMPADAGVVCPLADGVGGVLSPIVADDGLWSSTPMDDGVQLAGKPSA